MDICTSFLVNPWSIPLSYDLTLGRVVSLLGDLRATVPAELLIEHLDHVFLHRHHPLSEVIRFVLRVDYARWGQSPQDLRSLALSAPHARTRERALALFEITW